MNISSDFQTISVFRSRMKEDGLRGDVGPLISIAIPSSRWRSRWRSRMDRGGDLQHFGFGFFWRWRSRQLAGDPAEVAILAILAIQEVAIQPGDPGWRSRRWRSSFSTSGSFIILNISFCNVLFHQIHMG